MSSTSFTRRYTARHTAGVRLIRTARDDAKAVERAARLLAATGDAQLVTDGLEAWLALHPEFKS